MPNADFTPSFNPVDVDGDYGSTGGDITVPTFHELKPFRFWCQKALPLVYDDSLSYYELLCRVVNYLNNMMGDLTTATGSMTEFAEQFVTNKQFLNDMAEQLGENTEALQTYINERMQDFTTAYEELQDYVNDYFANLDITTEINNKLDTMAQNGTLSMLLEPLTEDWLEEKTAQIDTDLANQNQTLATQNGRISVLEGRMDGFSSLPAGSTSGNAELVGIRTNFLGEVYPTAGDAVRASDMIASGFSSIPFTMLAGWDGNETSLDWDTVQFDVTKYKGGHVAFIANMDNIETTITDGAGVKIYGSNVSGATVDDNAEIYPFPNGYSGFTSDVFMSYSVIPTTGYYNNHRYLIILNIPNDFNYQYIKVGQIKNTGPDTSLAPQPIAIVYATSWSKTPIDPTLTQPNEAADAKATGDEINSLDERLSDIYNGKTVDVVNGWQSFQFTIENGKTYKNISDIPGLGIRASLTGNDNDYQINVNTTFTATKTTNYIRLYGTGTGTFAIKEVGSIIDEIQNDIDDAKNDITNNTSEIKEVWNGITLSVSDYEKGAINNGANDAYRSECRIRNISITSYERDVTINTSVANCAFCIFFYDENGTYTTDSGWTTNYTIPANTKFRLTIDGCYRQTAQTLDVATILAKVTANSRNINDLYAQLANIQGGTLFVNVKDFGAVGDGVTDDTQAIQNAFEAIKNTGGTVFIPHGTYLINSVLFNAGTDTAGSLHIYSNSRLLMDENAVLLRGANTQRLLFAHNESTATEYDGCNNIVIEGGTFDANSSLEEHSGCLYFSHGQFITVKGVTFKNSWGSWHYIECNSSHDVVIENCRFLTGGTNGDIDIDMAHNSGNLGVSDDTPCYNVDVRGCYFKSLYHPGVQNHTAGLHHNIRIYNCIFYNEGSTRGAISFHTGTTKVDVFNNTFYKNTYGLNMISEDTTSVFHDNRCEQLDTPFNNCIGYDNLIDGVFTRGNV